jgi:hypothetical protein
MSPVDALIFGVMRVLSESEVLALLPISSDLLGSDHPLPAGLISVHSDVPSHTMGPTEAYRVIRLSVEWIGEDADGKGADDITDPLNELAREKLFVDDENETAQERLARHMEPKGVGIGIPMEVGSILPYTKKLGKDTTEFRRARGYFFEFHTERI